MSPGAEEVLSVWVIPLLLLVSPLAARPPSTELRALLSKQGFHAPLNKDSEVEYAGEIVQGKRKYQIYYYRYVIPFNKRGIGRLIIPPEQKNLFWII